MAKIQVLSSEEVDKAFSPVSRRTQREEEMRPYREAADQLGNGNTGGVIELEEGENPRLVMMRLHRAAHDKGLYLRFQRSRPDTRELKFRIQTEEEVARLKERGQKLAQARQQKSGARGRRK